MKDEDLDIGIVGGYRSKRTCVRMREEITKLQEILKDNGSPEVRPSPPARSRTTTAARASTKARSSGRTSDVGGSGGGGQESTTPVVGTSASSAPVKKYRRPAYSQFTHKRRKRRKKQPEEGEQSLIVHASCESDYLTYSSTFVSSESTICRMCSYYISLPCSLIL